MRASAILCLCLCLCLCQSVSVCVSADVHHLNTERPHAKRPRGEAARAVFGRNLSDSAHGGLAEPRNVRQSLGFGLGLGLGLRPF